MSEETVTAAASGEEVSQGGVAPEAQSTESQALSSTGNSLLSGEQPSSVFDSIFKDGAFDGIQDQGIRNWVSMQKDGAGFEKGLKGLQKLASSKGFERPDKNASQEEWDAFNEHMRELNGVPDNVDGYEFPELEGFNLTDENKTKIAEYAMEKGYAPEAINDMVPFMAELQKATDQAAEQQRIADQLKIADEYFGGEGSFNEKAPALSEWAEKNGFDVENDSAFRHASTYALIDKIMNLTSEDSSPVNVASVDRSGLESTISSMMNDKNHVDYDAFHNRSNPRHEEVMKRYVDLNKKLSDSKRR